MCERNSYCRHVAYAPSTYTLQTAWPVCSIEHCAWQCSRALTSYVGAITIGSVWRTLLAKRAVKLCSILPDSRRLGSVERQPKWNNEKKICVLIYDGIATIIIIIAVRNQCLLGCSECIQRTQHAYTHSAVNCGYALTEKQTKQQKIKLPPNWIVLFINGTEWIVGWPFCACTVCVRECARVSDAINIEQM